MSGPGVASLVVVTPCRDEEDHIGATVASLVGQTLRPALWVVVDDGSVDGTPAILAEAAREHGWIRVVRRESAARRVGPGVIDAFYSGLESVDLDGFGYVCKLDADLELPASYFACVIGRMEAEPRLGNFSGKVYTRFDDGRLVLERMGDEVAIGAAKCYRVGCFRDIGGFVRAAGWDGIDGHMCRLKGWVCGSEDLEEIRMVHRRLMGSSERGILHGRARWGRAKWFVGSSWFYMLAVFVYRLRDRPVLLASWSMLWGYLGAMLSGSERYVYPGFRAELRRFERDVLTRGRGEAIRRADARALAVWEGGR